MLAVSRGDGDVFDGGHQALIRSQNNTVLVVGSIVAARLGTVGHENGQNLILKVNRVGVAGNTGSAAARIPGGVNRVANCIGRVGASGKTRIVFAGRCGQ